MINNLTAKSSSVDSTTGDLAEVQKAYQVALATIDELIEEKDAIEKELLTRLDEKNSLLKEQGESYEAQISLQQDKLTSQQQQIELLIQEVEKLKSAD